MSKKPTAKKEKNLFYKMIYMAAVIVLLCSIALLLFNARYRDRLYEREVERAAVGETEHSIEEWENTETETQTQPETDALPETEAGTDSGAAAGTQAANRNRSLLVLNGTLKPGVAGGWKSILEQNGYTNVKTATYTGAAAQQTIIYVRDAADAALLAEQFPNAAFQVGSLQEGIEANEGETLPDQFDVYIVIGTDDADIVASEGGDAQTLPAAP